MCMILLTHMMILGDPGVFFYFNNERGYDDNTQIAYRAFTMCCQAKILAHWFEYSSQDHFVVAAFIISNEQKENGGTEKLSKWLKITQLETGRDKIANEYI